MYGKVEIIMRAKAAQANPNPGPPDTVIPTGKEGDAGDAEIVKPPIDFALLTATVQSTAPSSRERLAKPEKRAARRNMQERLTIPLYKSVISVYTNPTALDEYERD